MFPNKFSVSVHKIWSYLFKIKFILGWWTEKVPSWTFLNLGFPNSECPSEPGVRGCRPRREPGHPLPVWPHRSILCPHTGEYCQWPGEWVVSAGYWSARGRLETWRFILMILPSDLVWTAWHDMNSPVVEKCREFNLMITHVHALSKRWWDIKLLEIKQLQGALLGFFFAEGKKKLTPKNVNRIERTFVK